MNDEIENGNDKFSKTALRWIEFATIAGILLIAFIIMFNGWEVKSIDAIIIFMQNHTVGIGRTILIVILTPLVFWASTIDKEESKIDPKVIGYLIVLILMIVSVDTLILKVNIPVEWIKGLLTK